METFFTITYWVNMRPGSLHINGLRLYALILGILLILSFVFYLFKKRQRGLYFKHIRRLETFSLSNLFIGIMLLFFAYESIPFLSMRLWFLLWQISMMAWLAFIIKDIIKIPKIKEKIAKDNEYKKYIP